MQRERGIICLSMEAKYVIVEIACISRCVTYELRALVDYYLVTRISLSYFDIYDIKERFNFIVRALCANTLGHYCIKFLA